MTRFDVRGSMFDSSDFQPIEESYDFAGSEPSDAPLVANPVGQQDGDEDKSSSLGSGSDWTLFAGLFFSSGGNGGPSSGGNGAGPQGYGYGSGGNGNSGFGFNPGGATPSGGFGGNNGGGNGPLGFGAGGGGGSGGSAGSAPRVTSKDRKVVENEFLTGTGVLKAKDSDGVVTHYRFKDSAGGGWFELNGKKLAQNKWHQITAAQRAGLVYMAANNLTNTNFRFDDEVSIRARDNDSNWSTTKKIDIRNFNNSNRPIVYTTDTSLSSPKKIKMSSIFSTRDEDNNTIKKYRFRDANTDGRSGNLLYKGKAVKAGKWLTVSGENLKYVEFQSAEGNISDKVRIGAYDGQYWGHRNVNITSVGRPAIEVDSGIILDQLGRVSLSSLVSQTDSGPTAQLFQIFDSNRNSLSAKIVEGISPLAAGRVHTVTRTELLELDIQGGTFEDRRLDDFYIRASNGNEWSEWEQLSVRTEPHHVDAMRRDGWFEFIFTEQGQPLVVTYSFLQKTPDYYESGDERNNFLALTDSMREGARRALDYWSDVANITFVEVPDPEGGVIRFGTADLPDDVGAWAYLPGFSDPINYGRPGDVWLNNNGWPNNPPEDQIWWAHNDQTEGNWGFLVMLHELGHALGLAHPFDVSELPVLPPPTDSEQYTVMSYTGHPSFINDLGIQEKYASGPMLYDIATMELMYGATPRNNHDDTVYTYGSGIDDAVIKTIYDTGGTDVIDARNQAMNATIDLDPGAFSSIGRYQNTRIINGGLVDVTTNALQNIGIAFSSWIENAVGSSNNDTLLGNDIENRLDGRGGNDILNGRGGVDTLIGRNGNDTYQVRVTEEGDTIADRGSGTDVLELHSHISGNLGLDDFTDDLSFSTLGGNVFVHFSLNGNDDPHGSVRVLGGANNQIETLRIMNDRGVQIGPDIDFTSIAAAADFDQKQFVLTGASTAFGRIAAPIS